MHHNNLPAGTILSRKEDFGFVFSCPAGCIHITVRETSIRLSPEQYWTLLEMLTESATKMVHRKPFREQLEIH